MYSSVNHPIDCGLATTNSFSNYAKQKISDRSFDIIAATLNRVTIPGTSLITSYKDQSINRQTSAEYVTDYKIDLIFNNNIFDKIVSISSSNPSILSISSNNIATYQNDGYCTLKAVSTDGETSLIGVYAQKTYSGNIDIFIQWVNNSLAKNITDNIDNRIVNKNPTTAKNLFSLRNNSSNIYTRNIECWAYDLDTTCISPWNSYGGTNMAGVLISPRHVLFAAHYQPTVGTTIRYITNDNTSIVRTITAIQTDPLYSPYYPDIAVGLLDSDVPNSITFVKILPDNWLSYLPSISNIVKLPVFITDQEKKAMVADLNSITNIVTILNPNDQTRSNFYEYIIGGDSGSPVFLVINNQLVLITTWTSSSTGTFITLRKNTINSIMTSLGGGYQLTEVGLSSFISY